MKSFQFALLTVLLAAQASAVTFKITAQAAYDKKNPFEFVPNEINARPGDVLEFHFKGGLGSNFSVAMGTFDSPCRPVANGFFSGFFPAPAPAIEADKIFQVDVTSAEPMVFYCPQGQHCSRGMHGVVNGAGQRTLQAYRNSIPVHAPAVIPSVVGGGRLLPNPVAAAVTQPAPAAAAAGGASSTKSSLAGMVGVVGLALLMA